MLQITIPSIELWNESTEEFVYMKERTLQLEHSLVSLSKWESKWCKSFISNKNITEEETMDYIRCMTLTQNVPKEVYDYMPDSVVKQITDYINAPMTATYFSGNNNKKTSREPVTSEIIYYWMIAMNIPFECQKWHLNRLLTLIRVCNIKNKPPKKMSKRSVMSRNAALNAARKQRLGTMG